LTRPAARSEAERALPGEAAVAEAARRSLDGDNRGLARIWPFLGPAFIAAVAYVDPGNFATNVTAGAKFGYLLLWVVLAANLVAMLVQAQSAKLGIATGKNLAELCRERFRAAPRSVSGCRPRWSRWPATWPRSSAPRSASTCSSASRCSSPG
jgi:hypothetical protein